MAKQLCSECNFMPKAPNSNRYCEECRLRHRPMPEQIIARQERLVRHSQTMPGALAHRARVPEREWPEHRRWCAGCQCHRMFRDFSGYWNVGEGEEGCTASRCKPCAYVASSGARIEKLYGVTPEEYKAKLAEQEGVCAICHQPPVSKRLAQDHDHQTGEPRGLLCSRCNHDLLGAAHDSLEILERAVSYMKRYASAAVTPTTTAGRPFQDSARAFQPETEPELDEM